MKHFATNFCWVGEEGEVFFRQHGCGLSRSVVIAGKSTFSEEETERIISMWGEEEVLFNSRHKDFFKNDVRQNAIKPQFLHQLPVNVNGPKLCRSPVVSWSTKSYRVNRPLKGCDNRSRNH